MRFLEGGKVSGDNSMVKRILQTSGLPIERKVFIYARPHANATVLTGVIATDIQTVVEPTIEPKPEFIPISRPKAKMSSNWSGTNTVQSFDIVMPAKFTHVKHISLSSSPTLPKHPAVRRTELEPTRSKVLVRRAVAKPEKQVHKRDRFVARFMTSLAVFVMMFGAGVSLRTYLVNKSAASQIQGVTTTQSENNDSGILDAIPLEDEPKGFPAAVMPENPKQLLIESLNVKANILSVGISTNSIIKGTKNIFDVGWYENSALPGDDGAVVLVGHISGPTKPGAFNQLTSLNKGDELTVVTGNGKRTVYTVVANEAHKVSDFDIKNIVASKVSGKRGLNLMTFHNPNDKTHTTQTVVYAIEK